MKYNKKSFQYLKVFFKPTWQGDCKKFNSHDVFLRVDRAQSEWAYEFPDRTGPDTQICQTGPVGPDWIQTYIFNILPNKYRF